jgi:hypothetical protein
MWSGFIGVSDLLASEASMAKQSKSEGMRS